MKILLIFFINALITANGFTFPELLYLIENEIDNPNTTATIPTTLEAIPTQATEDDRECGVFDTQTPSENDEPLIRPAIMRVVCTSEEKYNCHRACVSLAQAAAQEHGPELLCFFLGQYNKLKASVHSRICNDEKWQFTGLICPHRICCKFHKLIDCQNETKIIIENAV